MHNPSNCNKIEKRYISKGRRPKYVKMDNKLRKNNCENPK